MESFDVIGLMSGTSLDGLDIAHCKFIFDNKWHFNLTYHETVFYSNEQKNELANLENESAINYMLFNTEFGKLMGNEVNKFIEKNKITNVDFIASHGHTVFHQPKNNLTTQIGCGAQIAATTGIETICDFRTKDVALGGQGAPLVPIGDELLFSAYDYCLNLGGIANISFKAKGKRISYDLAMANMVNNYICSLEGIEYDNEGKLGASGNFNHNLFNDLNAIAFFSKPHPKSLGKENFINNFKPILDKYDISNADKLNTFGKHLAHQVCKTLSSNKNKKVLITGGGAFNSFWISEIKNTTNAQIIIPENKIIEYKEAVIFGFLGVLRKKQLVNCLASVTGAKEDSIGGTIYL
jgi:anhydro-N-acetylmuramic acid kinase